MPDTVLITGGSSGIGLELAHLFARDGNGLVLVSRGEEKLRQLAAQMEEKYGVPVLAVAKDLTVPSAPDELAERLAADGQTVDVLVNNAGFGSYGLFQDSDPDNNDRMIEVNVAALTRLTRLLLRGMLSRKRGRILNVASTAAFQPGPLMAVYYATKAYVLSFSEALANELRGSGVSVTALCPGPTATGFEERADLGQSRLFRRRLMDAATVAAVGYRACLAGKTVVVPGWRNNLLGFATRFLPRNTVTALVRQAQERAPD